MAFNLHNRSFLKLLDFTPREIRFLLDLSAGPQAREVRRVRAAAPAGQEHRDHLREGLHANPGVVRGRGLRPGRPRDVPRPERIADRPQGVDEGHGARAWAHLRRHRVPRLRPGDRRGARRVRRRAGLERAHGRVPSHPDPGRLPDDDRVQRQAAVADLVLLPRGRPQQHGRLAHGRWRQDGHGRTAVRAEAPLARRGPCSRRAGPSRNRPAPASRSATTRPRRSRASTSCTPTCGSRWARTSRSGTSASSFSSPTR